MNIWVVKAKLIGPDGKSQRLTLKIEGQGEDPEVEILFGGETPTQETEVFQEDCDTAGGVVAAEEPTEKTLTPVEVEIMRSDEKAIQDAEEVSNSSESSGNKDLQDAGAEVVADLVDANKESAFTNPAEGQEVTDAMMVEETEDSERPVDVVVAEANEMPAQSLIAATATTTAAEKITEEITADQEQPMKKALTPEEMLKEIAAQSSNFENFLGNLADFLELQKRKEYFVNVATAATQVFKINWSTIEMTMKKNGVKWNSYDKIWTSKQVTKKFEEIGINLSIMSLIKQIATYRDFKFVRTKMECLPEIPQVEDALRQMSQEADVHAKVKILLDVIGANQQVCVHQEAFYRIGSAAVQSEDLKNLETTSPFQNGSVDLEQKAKQDECLKKIIRDAGISENSAIEVRMHMTTLINNFVEKHSPDAKAIKLLTFLKELQEVCT